MWQAWEVVNRSLRKLGPLGLASGLCEAGSEVMGPGKPLDSALCAKNTKGLARQLSSTFVVWEKQAEYKAKGILSVQRVPTTPMRGCFGGSSSLCAF